MKKIPVDIPGSFLLEDPLYNKGTAFTEEERVELNLDGLLPFHVSTIEEQVKRRYVNFSQLSTATAKYNFLNALQNRNETLFYRLVLEHADEMMPYIYIPHIKC